VASTCRRAPWCGFARPGARGPPRRVIDAKGATARYVRLYSNGNTSDELNHYCEVEVHGSVAK